MQRCSRWKKGYFYARVILWQFKVDRLQILYDCNNRILLYVATHSYRMLTIGSSQQGWMYIFSSKQVTTRLREKKSEGQSGMKH